MSRNADFTPSRGEYKSLTPFRYWCQKVLPLVYDDALSYYELLCKVVDYLNKTMEDTETLNDDVTNLYTAYQQLQDWVNAYYESEDFAQAIDDGLDRMAESGQLTTLMTAIINPQLPDLVDHLLPETVLTLLPDEVQNQLPGVVGDQIGATVANQIGATVAGQIGSTVAGQISPVVANQLPGVVSNQIDAVVADEIVDPVEDWLGSNVGAGNAIDRTLSIVGAGADAAFTGVRLETLDSVIGYEHVSDTGFIITTASPYAFDEEAITTGAEFSDLASHTYKMMVIPVDTGAKYCINAHKISIADISETHFAVTYAFCAKYVGNPQTDVPRYLPTTYSENNAENVIVTVPEITIPIGQGYDETTGYLVVITANIEDPVYKVIDEGLRKDISDLKSDLSVINDAVYATETYINQSTGQVGDQSMFIAYFNSPTYIATFQPLFAVQGTFKWGIFTANGAVDNNASRGDTTWKDTLETGSVISLNRVLNPNEALVVQAISPAVSRNGVALASCEIDAHFAKLGGTYVADYFGKEYGYPGIFTAPKIKDIPDATNMSKSVYVSPDGYTTHSEVIASAISKAVANGSRHVILQKGDFIITDTIKVPSNFHLEFDNANVKLASGANCNIIASANIDDLSQAEHITITANNCVLDGNHSEQTINNNSYKRIGVLMFNVDGFDISGFTVKNTHGWGMSFESGCQNGKIHDIRIDQDGNHVNQDGIDIRGGCHDIEIYNITGYAHDDCIACTALLGNVMQVLNDGTNGKDIYNISIHDIEMESGYCNVVDLICHDTCKTHDISVYNINDRSEAGKTFISSGAYSHTVRIGNYDFSNYAISGTTGTKDDMYNINVHNVVCNSYMGIGIGWACKDVTVRNVKMLENVGRGIELHDAQQMQFIVQNLLIASVYAIGASNFLFWRNVKGNVQNALLSDITVMNCYYFLYDFYADMAYQNFAVLRANLYKGTSLYYLADDSAMYLDAFYVPSVSAFYSLYPQTHAGQITLGNNMPFRS